MATKKTGKVEKSQRTEAQRVEDPSEVITGQNRAVAFFEITGITTLIQNCFAQKSLEEMLRKHMGLNQGKEKKKPAQVIENAKVFNTQGVISVPAAAIKKAMITASGAVKSFQRQKTSLRITIFVAGGGAIPLEYKEWGPRVDMVRLKNGSPDVRFRPEFRGWRMRFGVEYDDNALNIRSVMDLVNRAGYVGLCEWRPEKNGDHGMFSLTRQITDKKEIKEILANCAHGIKPAIIPEWAMNADIDMDALRSMLQESENAEDDASPSEKKGKGSRVREAAE